MRAAIWMVLLAGVCAAQERPVAGYFCDGAGALRVLEGVEGAWVSRMVVPEGVLSAGFDGQVLWYKTERTLHVRGGEGEWVELDAPAGTAEAERGLDGRIRRFVFPEAGVAAEWLGRGLGDAAAWERAGAGEEWISGSLRLLRQGGSLYAGRAGEAPALVPAAEAVTFQLFLRNGGQETAVGTSFVMPAAAPGETSEARFRVRNPGSAPVLINRLSVDPGVFQIFEQFYPPRFIEAGGFADFAVRFAPAAAGGYSATLYLNDQKVMLNASSTGAPVVEMELQGGWTVLKAGTVVEMGAVERRSVLRRALRVTPAEGAQVSGEGFSLLDGSGSGNWVVSFLGDKAGTSQGSLVVGGRVFPLRVTVSEFPTPRPALVMVSEAKTAAQVRFRVKLSEAARTAYTAAVSLEFAPEAGLPDDPAVALLPQAVRSVPVRIEEGAAESGELAFQTGTTAGRVTVGVTLGAYSEQSVFRVIAEPVVLTAVKASAASANAEIVLTGYDTTRSVSKAAFTFYRKDGQAAAPGRLEADVSGAFGSYYKSNNGGAFTLRANFPVAGTYSELEGVEVELVNSTGTRQTGRLRFE